MNSVQRNKDVISMQEDLEDLYRFDNFPVFMGCVDHPPEEDLLFDMSWKISKGSGAIQLDPLVPLEILYAESHGSGNVGGMWLEHHQSFAKFIYQYKPVAVLEVGGAHGVLSREYRKSDRIDWTVVEPNPSPTKGVSATFIKGFFDNNFNFDGKVDTIVHSHVFEHVYHPNDFISNISNFLEESQKLIFSLPNMEKWLKEKYTNCLNFEHTVFLTEPYIDYLLSQHGFMQIGKEYFKDDHSIFYAYVKRATPLAIELPEGLYEYNKGLFLNFIKHHQDLIESLNRKIERVEGERSIYLFGAHIFAQYLVEFGLNVDRICCVLDNDENKQGKRLYGTNMMVESPAILATVDSPIVILKAGVYNEEIMKGIGLINPATVFFN